MTIVDRLDIRDERIDSPVGAPLVQAQWRELLDRYGVPDADPDGLTADHLAPPDGVFLVAWSGDEPVGCGGVRRYDDHTGEIKRMYVAPEHRRLGISRALLLALESRARAIGYTRLVLETGTRQPEAIALYESEGYVRIESYGYYRDAPASRCYGKELASLRGVEQHRDRVGAAEGEALDQRRRSVGIEAQVRQPIEDGVEPDA